MSPYSDDSESECDDPQEVLSRYSKAQYQRALSSPDNYYRACQELFQLYRVTFQCPGAGARARKCLFAELVRDTPLAIELCDGLARNTRICRALVDEAVRVLPRVKGKELRRLLKTHSLKSAREGIKIVRSLQQSDAPPAIQQIPGDVLGAVFDRLGPFALAAAACACKQWHAEAYKDDRWQPFARAVLGRAASAVPPQSWRKLFNQVATGGHSRVAHLQTRRRMLRKTLLWLDTPAWQEAPDFKCVGPREVATFILKGSIEEGFPDNSDSSENDEERPICTRRGHMAPPIFKLWRTFPAHCSLKLEGER